MRITSGMHVLRCGSHDREDADTQRASGGSAAPPRRPSGPRVQRGARAADREEECGPGVDGVAVRGVDGTPAQNAGLGSHERALPQRVRATGCLNPRGTAGPLNGGDTISARCRVLLRLRALERVGAAVVLCIVGGRQRLAGARERA